MWRRYDRREIPACAPAHASFLGHVFSPVETDERDRRQDAIGEPRSRARFQALNVRSSDPAPARSAPTLAMWSRLGGQAILGAVTPAPGKPIGSDRQAYRLGVCLCLLMHRRAPRQIRREKERERKERKTVEAPTRTPTGETAPPMRARTGASFLFRWVPNEPRLSDRDAGSGRPPSSAIIGEGTSSRGSGRGGRSRP